MNISPIIDADGHIVEPKDLWEKYTESKYRDEAPRIVLDNKGKQRWMIAGRLFHVPEGKGCGIPLGERLDERPKGSFDGKIRLQDMSRDGIDIAVLFPTAAGLVRGANHAKAEAAYVRAYNNWLSDYCGADTSRLKGVALVPMLDMEEAVKEIERVAKIDHFAGIVIPGLTDDKHLDDPFFGPMWAAAQAADMTAAVHAATGLPPIVPVTERFDNFFLTHMFSHPIAQMIAISTITAGGVFDRYQELKIVFLESGIGWVPWWIERLDEHYERLARLVPNAKCMPSIHLKGPRAYYSCDPDEASLPDAFARLGDDRIVYASDYPHWDMRPASVRMVMDRTDISEVQKRKLFADNPLKLFSRIKVGQTAAARKNTATA